MTHVVVFAVCLVIGGAAAALARSAPRGWLRLLGWLALIAIIVAPVALLACYIAAGLLLYHERAYGPFFRDLFGIMSSPAGLTMLIGFGGAAAGGLAVFRRPWSRFVKRFVFVSAGAFLAILGSAAISARGSTLPASPSTTAESLRATVESNQVIFVSTRNGLEPVCWCGPKLALHEFSSHLRDAVIAIEDRRFHDHRGADPRALLRAAASMFLLPRAEGGSTITMQLLKNTVLTSRRNLSRKVDEIALSLRLEQAMTKNEILAAYLNQVSFGSTEGFPIIGAEQAARHFFGRRARDLNLFEAATLAGMLRAPAQFDPIRHPERSLQRSSTVLAAMAAQGKITKQQAVNALRARRARGREELVRAYTKPFVDWLVADLIRNKLLPAAPDATTRIAITLDFTAQAQTDARIARMTLPVGGPELEMGYLRLSSDGGVSVMVGQRDRSRARMSFAAQASRPVASTFKVFIYAYALQQRIVSPSAQLTRDFARSDNGAAQALLQRIGPAEMVKFMTKAGVRSKLRPDPSLALGSSEMPLTELLAVYRGILQGGYVEPFGMKTVVQAGNIWEPLHPAGPRLVSEQVNATMRMMMRQTVLSGTAKPASRIPNAAGKTGTSQDERDGWFIGMTDRHVSGIWLGNPDNSPVPGLTGMQASFVWTQLEQ
jgi:penicillin-binding protein 1A